MIASLAPLGEEYIETLKSFKDKRYIDVRKHQENVLVLITLVYMVFTLSFF